MATRPLGLSPESASGGEGLRDTGGEIRREREARQRKERLGGGETKEQGDQDREGKEGEVGVGPQLVQLLLEACLCCGAVTILRRLQACLALRADREDRRDQGRGEKTSRKTAGQIQGRACRSTPLHTSTPTTAHPLRSWSGQARPLSDAVGAGGIISCLRTPWLSE